MTQNLTEYACSTVYGIYNIKAHSRQEAAEIVVENLLQLSRKTPARAIRIGDVLQVTVAEMPQTYSVEVGAKPAITSFSGCC